MFEPQKLITLFLAGVLLAPFGYIFWRIAAHRPRPEAEVREQILADLRERSRRPAEPSPDGDFTTSTYVVKRYEAIGIPKSTMSWLVFFPRQSAGVVGLIGVACIFVALIVSLFFPRAVEASSSELPPSPPGEEPQR